MIVVPVLITNCHVSEYLKKGPDAAHTRMRQTDIRKAPGLPARLAVAFAKCVKYFSIAVPQLE
jgi:hypothetical protein